MRVSQFIILRDNLNIIFHSFNLLTHNKLHNNQSLVLGYKVKIENWMRLLYHTYSTETPWVSHAVTVNKEKERR
jgi:hypothetical protein